MKKIFKYLAIALIGWAAVSCAKNIMPEPQPNEEEDSPYMQTFTCTIADADPDTRFAIDATGKTTWEPGDQILIHGEYLGERDANKDGVKEKYSTVVTLRDVDITNEGRTATIRIAVDNDGLAGIKPYVRDGATTTLYAAYPADAVKYSEGLHVYNFTDFTNTNRPLMVGYDKGDNTFAFENVCSAISFTVPSQAPEDNFTSFEFSGNGHEIIGYSQYSVQRFWSTSGSVSGDKPYTWGGETNGEVYTITGSVVCDGSTKVFVYIVPKWVEDSGDGKNFNKYDVSFSSGFKIKFFKGSEATHYIANLNNITLGSGKYLNLGDISSHLKPYTPAEDKDSGISLEGAYNLSASKTANCYLLDSNTELAANKVYKFKATRGNSSASVGTVKSVVVLWETDNTDVAVTTKDIIDQVDFDRHGDECYIVFKMPSSLTYGNALIAAKNDDEVLWSWHIWVPQTDVSSGTYGISTPAMMDRNLGALVTAGGGDIRANGMLYQWGRKDPFPSPGQYGSSTLAARAGVPYSVSSAAYESITLSVKNPTVFAKSSGNVNSNPEYSSDTGDWLVNTEASRWGSSKTVYDPCPPGWKVPSSSECAIFNSSTKPHLLDGYAYDLTNKCITIGTAVFPLTGRLSYSGSMEYRETRALLWSASSVATGERYENCATWMDVSLTVSGDTATTSSNHYSEKKARGASVRCVAE